MISPQLRQVSSKCPSVLRRGGDFSWEVKTNWRERLSQLPGPAKVQCKRLPHLRKKKPFAFKASPSSIYGKYLLHLRCMRRRRHDPTRRGTPSISVSKVIINNCKTYFTIVARSNTVIGVRTGIRPRTDRRFSIPQSSRSEYGRIRSITLLPRRSVPKSCFGSVLIVVRLVR